MFKFGIKLEQVALVVEEINRYSLVLLWVAEPIWTGTGKPRLEKSLFGTEGKTTITRRKLLSLSKQKKHANTLLQLKPITGRQFFCRNELYTKLSVVVAYVPKDIDEEDVKDHFHSTIQRALHGIPRHNILPVMGDFNAMVDSNNEGHGSTWNRSPIVQKRT